MLCIEESLQLYCLCVVEKCWILRYTFLMSNSVVLCDNFLFSNGNAYKSSLCLYNSSSRLVQISFNRRKFCGLLPNAKKRHSKKKKSWWRKFFFEDEGNWLGLKDEDMVDDENLETEPSGDEELTENEKFEAWKQRAEAIVELREAQEGIRNEENKMWEDWIIDGKEDVASGSSWVGDSNGDVRKPGDNVREDPVDIISQRGLVKKMRDMLLGKEEDEILFEDRVFRYASYNSAKFLAVLVLIPWAMDFLVHDYVLMPFLDRYVKTVPFAAQLLDVRRSQKLEIVKEINLVKSRYRLEVEIGKSPPLSDEEVWEELHNKALELRDERRLENRRAFANIWSDAIYGVTLFILLYLNQSEVALLKFTGYKLINNISDTGKAFVIILLTDIFLGYHSESGWKTLCEVIVEHYGIEVNEAAITIFVSLVPVFIDACVKLWLFKYLPRLSPKVTTIFKEMTRH